MSWFARFYGGPEPRLPVLPDYEALARRRHNRILVLTRHVLEGATDERLRAEAAIFGVSDGTARSYIRAAKARAEKSRQMGLA